jgi:hypothetical protein
VRWTYVVPVVGVVVVVAVLLAVLVYLPPLAVDSHGLSRTDWLTHVESLRAAILQGLGGLGALVAVLSTLYFSARTLRLNRRGQLTERFTKAIELIGSDNVAIRLGGVYALEAIGWDSPGWHWSAMEVLTTVLREAPFVRDRAAEEQGIPTVQQAIASVLARRRREYDPREHDPRGGGGGRLKHPTLISQLRSFVRRTSSAPT